MSLRLDIATALRDANRRGSLHERELIIHIKKALYEFDQRPRPKRTSTGQTQFTHVDMINNQTITKGMV